MLSQSTQPGAGALMTMGRTSTAPVYRKPIPRTDQEFVAYVRRFVDEARRMRYRFERQWMLNIAYYLGLHYMSWDGWGRNLREPQVPSYRVRLVVNAMMSTIETGLAKMLKNRPICEVRPATSDDDDIAGAKLAMQVAENLSDRLDEERKRAEWCKWALICGTAYWHEYWDGQAGPRWQELGNAGEELTLSMGDNGCEVVSPFDVLVASEGPHLNAAQKMCRRKRMLVEEARERWPGKADLLKPNALEDSENSMDLRILTLGMYGGDIYGAEPAKPGENVTLYELWELPAALSDEERKEWPRGRVITATSNVLLDKIPHPYRHGQLPYTQLNAIDVPGRFYGMSIIDQIASINRSYNRALSKVMENMVLMSNPKWIMPTSAAQGMNSIDSEPGGIIRFADGSTPPQAITPQSLVAQGHFEAMKIFMDNMQEVSGLREVSRGSAPPGVTSGVAINLLQEQDDTRLGLVIKNLERGIERSGKQRLELVQQFYIEPRVMKIAGEDSSFDSIDFTGADLHGNTDLIVVAGSAMPQNKTARAAMILDYWNAGLIPHDGNGLQVVWRLLDGGMLEKLFREEQVDRTCADTENRRMKRGLPQPVFRWQDHAVHKARVDIVRKRPDFATMPPEIQQIFNNHWDAHDQMEKQIQMEQAQAQGQPQMPGMMAGHRQHPHSDQVKPRLASQ